LDFNTSCSGQMNFHEVLMEIKNLLIPRIFTVSFT
jgi:hypothetical protein